MTLSLTRREALKAGAAFVLGFYLPPRGLANSSVPADAEAFKANAWVRVTTDNRITLLTEIPEMGQGTRTANVMMLADELEVEWSSIQWEQAPTIPKLTSIFPPAAAAERPPPGSQCEERERKLGNCSWPRRPSNGALTKRIAKQKKGPLSIARASNARPTAS